MAGNDAIFTGSVTNGADVKWTTEYGSSLPDSTPAPVTVSCRFDLSGNKNTAVSNLATAYSAACPEGSGQSASSNGAIVTFVPSAGITGMTVDGTKVSTSGPPTPVGHTGLSVSEPPS